MKLLVAFVVCCIAVAYANRIPDDAVQLPSPTVAFTVNPNMTRKAEYFPTCHPTVQDTFTAFWCYYDLEFSVNYAGLVSPSTPNMRYPMLTLRDSFAYLDLTPQPLSETSALFGSNAPDSSSWAAATTNAILGPEDRFNSTAMPAVDPVAHTAFIPYGVHMGKDMLTVVDLTEVNHPRVSINSTWRHVIGDDGLSLLRDIVAYEGFVFFMHNNTMYKLNATTMSDTDGGFIVKDPCNIGLRARNGVNLKMVTYGSDANGPLNAFIVYGNTTNETRAEFAMCRVSHITGQLKWVKFIADDFDVADITGGAGTLILLTGYAASVQPLKYVTLVSSVLTGNTYGSVLRQHTDEGAFPVFVPTGVVTFNSTVPCGPAFILQVANAATAYCVAPFVVYNHPITPAWTARGYECMYRPAYDPVTKYVACISPGNYLAALTASQGKGVWVDSFNMYLSRPQIINDGGASYVFLSDLDSTLWGFKMALPPPPTTRAPPVTFAPTSAPTGNTGSGGSSGLTGGQAAGVTIGVIFAVAIVAIVAIVYFRRSKRRSGYKPQQQQNAINEYGAMS